MPRFVPNTARKISSSVSTQRPKKPTIKDRLHFKKELALRIKRAAGLEIIDLTKSKSKKSKNREKVSREIKKYQTSVKIIFLKKILD